MSEFSVKAALLGAPVELRNGCKAYIVRELKNTGATLLGYYVTEEGKEKPSSWFANGLNTSENREELDIIGMYEEKPIVKIEGNNTYKPVNYFGHILYVPHYTKAIAADRDGAIYAYDIDELTADVPGGYWESAREDKPHTYAYVGHCTFGSLQWDKSVARGYIS